MAQRTGKGQSSLTLTLRTGVTASPFLPQAIGTLHTVCLEQFDASNALTHPQRGARVRRSIQKYSQIKSKVDEIC